MASPIVVVNGLGARGIEFGSRVTSHLGGLTRNFEGLLLVLALDMYLGTDCRLAPDFLFLSHRNVNYIRHCGLLCTFLIKCGI